MINTDSHNADSQNPYFRDLVDEHRSWLGQFNCQHAANWEKLRNNCFETACCEAGIRRFLELNKVSVSPNETLKSDGSGPDFDCAVDGTRFYVEATCIRRTKATEKTGIAEKPSGPSGFNPYGMARLVFRKCKGKASQCGDMDAPTLLSVGTFHGLAAMVGFEQDLISSVLTGDTMVSWDVEVGTGQRAGKVRQVTKLECAAFLRLDREQGITFDRNSLSGLILCGLGTPRCAGVLHPNPVRPFDPTLLPSVRFAQVRLDRDNKLISVSWPDSIGD